MLKNFKTKPNSSFVLSEYHEETPNRVLVERFIAERFFIEHGALINEFMPILLAVYNSENEIIAATGVRCSENHKLFLESYLKESVEHVLVNFDQMKALLTPRQEIAEIGNLASTSIAASRFLFNELFHFCINQNYKWVVFTSCQRLRKAFEYLNITLIKLAEANESLLSSEDDWGTYYQDNPAVMAGYLPSSKAVFAPMAQGVTRER